ncbi:hypothetical protein N9D23_05200 [Rubripirellula sp.]|nr:hypothetical protein [Rubripirellula sp.]
MSDARQDLAEVGSSEELQGDDRLFKALVYGCHVENAAESAGVSQRTAYRRLADPEFRGRLEEARQGLREAILAKLADAGDAAVSTLWDLMQTAEDENVRMRSAKAVLDTFLNFHSKNPRVETTTRTVVEQTRRTVDDA